MAEQIHPYDELRAVAVQLQSHNPGLDRDRAFAEAMKERPDLMERMRMRTAVKRELAAQRAGSSATPVTVATPPATPPAKTPAAASPPKRVTAYQALNEAVSALQATMPALTEEQAFTEALKRPELAQLYTEHRDEINRQWAAERERPHAASAERKRAPEPAPGSALAELNDLASQRAARTGETHAQAFTEVLQQRPELYTRYRQEAPIVRQNG